MMGVLLPGSGEGRRWSVRCATVVVLGSVLLAGACSSVTVRSDWDREFDFASLKSYDWLAREREGGRRGDPMASSPLMQSRVQAAVNDQLQRKGYVRTPRGGADFLVVAYVGSRDKRDVSRATYVGRRGWVHQHVYVDEYTEGTVLIDIVDRRSGDLVWRGMARGALGSGEQAVEKVPAVVAKLLAEFPPA